ncbi:hypothetical protein [Streptomyces sp. NPDC014623]|uniref:hypothetical protein n=1 Tax=Streptomyces sp. NPDC014623 TaxID=3364875 RepID=UPI003703303E
MKSRTGDAARPGVLIRTGETAAATQPATARPFRRLLRAGARARNQLGRISA